MGKGKGRRRQLRLYTKIELSANYDVVKNRRTDGRRPQPARRSPFNPFCLIGLFRQRNVYRVVHGQRSIECSLQKLRTLIRRVPFRNSRIKFNSIRAIYFSIANKQRASTFAHAKKKNKKRNTKKVVPTILYFYSGKSENILLAIFRAEIVSISRRKAKSVRLAR